MAIIDTTKDLSALFLRQVQITPDAVALEDDKSTFTYTELDSETSVLADRLRRHGVGRDQLVGVLLGRSADYVIACLAALRAGGAFLVLERAYPQGLLSDVIEDAKATVIVTDRAHSSQVKADVKLIVLDEPDGTGTDEAAQDLAPLPADDDLDRLAFVSYSSGTTGRDRVACNVFFIWEMLRPLLRGATVYTVPDDASYDPVALVHLLGRCRISETLMTPTLLATILSRHPQLDLPHLRTLWLNGEVVSTELAKRALQALPSTRLLNCYSASETHEIACGDVGEMLDAEAAVCPVGRPLIPEYTYVLDQDLNKLPAGKSGELFIGGPLLARGYLGLAETTAQAFRSDPFDPTPGARMYATGDVARVLPSGLLEITGRVGSMIKVRGYSIQPGAVEKVIVKHLAVRECAVVAHGDELERQLVAYVVRDPEPGTRTVLTIDDSAYSPAARRALGDHLAHYMIPALWVELESLPAHEVSGKIDHNRLPPPTPKARTGRTLERDQTVKIETIAELWADTLKVPVSAVTQEHDFFDLGGHSLALADLARRFSDTFGFHVPLSRLAGAPRLSGHVDVVRAARDGHTAAVQADLPAVLRADSALPDEIQGRGSCICALREARTVLLTGVTGYLGAFLLRAILESSGARVICLVRFGQPTVESGPRAMARVRKNLLDLGIWDDSILDRIEIVAGNLGRERLGLAPHLWDDLAGRVQVIVHAAATVNLVYPYASMRNANAGGTREILRLASRSGATVHHISTNGVLPRSTHAWPEDAVLEMDDVPDKLLDGYGQTKWVAEQLVREAGRRGMPVRIYRPGTISGHSILGSTNTYDLLTAVMVESIQLGFSPDLDGWLAEMTPVDFVSKAIVTLCNHIDSEQLVYHLGDPRPITASALFDSLAELGYSTERLAWDDWVALWREKRNRTDVEENTFTVGILSRGMPTADSLKAVTVLNDAATQPVLGKYGLQRPKIDSRLFRTYTRDFYARGWLSRAPCSGPSIPEGPLSGRVAIVTGASSGIGAAVATALAREGVHVALAARRGDALERVKTRLCGYGVKSVAYKTDVTDKAQVEALVQSTAELLGPVDILVSCAGVMYFTLMENVQTEEWERTVEVNCKGLLHCLSSTVPGMLSRGRGHVVAISSDAGRKVFPGLGVYSASKFFVEATLQALRLETAGRGLRVTSLQPGNVATDLLGLSTDGDALQKYGVPSGAKVLDAEDVAGAVVYALRQPEQVAVNEVLLEPRDEPI